MTIRNFKNCDAENLLSLWNAAHPRYKLSKELIAKKIFLDVNFSSENILIVEKKDKIIAFAYLPYHTVKLNKNFPFNEKEGFITYFSIDPNEDFDKVGKMLLKACEEYHYNAGRTILSTAYAPLYHLQGFSESEDAKYIELFSSFGYNECKSYSRRMSLAEFKLPENFEERKAALEQKGFYIGELPYNHLEEFVSSENCFSNAAWSWEYGTRLSHNPDLSRARVAIYDGKIIGGCMFSDPNSDSGRFGPFGINHKFRGNGIGSVLFNDCLNELKAKGISSAWAQWTPPDGTANILYNKAGFLMEDCFYTFSKELTNV